jgi:limonene-1,2-epoxide hydrolase
MGHKATLRRFFDDLESLDMKKVAAYCAKDCSYEDVPAGDAATAVGRDAIRAKLEGAFANVDKLVTTIHEMAKEGDTVLVERTEVWHHPTGEQVSLPVMAVFKFRKAKIVLWRDYWDMKTLMESQPASWLQSLAAAGAET